MIFDVLREGLEGVRMKRRAPPPCRMTATTSPERRGGILIQLCRSARCVAHKEGASSGEAGDHAMKGKVCVVKAGGAGRPCHPLPLYFSFSGGLGGVGVGGW